MVVLQAISLFSPKGVDHHENQYEVLAMQHRRRSGRHGTYHVNTTDICISSCTRRVIATTLPSGTDDRSGEQCLVAVGALNTDIDKSTDW
jgi:hypothetical protein